ncbi:protein FAM32A-like [Lingula anatina]|uniref:Protein FAM32A-like n=1 Tax=Lingula anatina TaxID=7574 RepID=A0A1S3ICZ7_LINAN|nr:protein FAM32A-like [Lingula anatina]|eukprot:XP_013396038.1 protein FAM32A-like [Lingula anatina]
MSEYENVAKGSLKLKGVSDGGVKKKKKKKSKDREKEVDPKKILEQMAQESSSGSQQTYFRVDKRTKAEMAFERAKEKREAEKIIDKAAKSHKERIMDFNAHLDNLTEHFDIPKVSWTK